MTTLAGLYPPAQPSGFEALLIAVGRWLVSTGERRAAREHTMVDHRVHEDRLRDGTALRHSGLWL
ncbi:hypothetical protein ASH00_01925 [Arthrobacter sp. Soil782]|uniref:hypothetical protein n=1 Tax=Arthrobacter sp. Soil782 TaxID=1736410 RepID=UPI0006FB6B3E|nr:hypothetical protein [Arthrobacter sp. Soil782]KRF08500.1 hypothetical protein ASH00_01925 [Arthrobacter sp. Soil782]